MKESSLFSSKVKPSLEEILENKEVFIFDFDGTIADTERYSWMAYNHSLSEFNVKLSTEDVKRYIGNNDLIICSMIKKDFGIDFETNSMIKRTKEKYISLLEEHNLKPFKEIKLFLDGFRNARFVILSAQKESVIISMLNKWGYANRFEKVISTSESTITKSEVLADTLSYYGAKQEKCVLLEDTEFNLKLGKDNNIYTIGVEHLYNKGNLESAAYVVHTSTQPSTIKAITFFSSAVGYVELSEHLQRYNVVTTMEESVNTNVNLIVLSYKDVEAYESGINTDVLEAYLASRDTSKKTVIVVESNSELSGNVEHLQHLNNVASMIGIGDCQTMTYNKSITANGYLACGISNVIKKENNNKYIQLHNLLLTDNGGVIEEYESL